MVPYVRGLRKPRPDLPRSFRSPVLAIQLAVTVDEASQVLGDRPTDPRRESTGRSTWLDFGFIPVYWFLFLATSLILVLAPVGWAVGAGIAAAIVATLAAELDVLENWALLRLLEVRFPQRPDEKFAARDPDRSRAMLRERGAYEPLVLRVSMRARIKWALTFVAVGCLSLVFLGPALTRLVQATSQPVAERLDFWSGAALCTSGLYVVCALLGLLGVLRRDARIEWAFVVLLVGLLFAAPVLRALARDPAAVDEEVEPVHCAEAGGEAGGRQGQVAQLQGLGDHLEGDGGQQDAAGEAEGHGHHQRRRAPPEGQQAARDGGDRRRPGHQEHRQHLSRHGPSAGRPAARRMRADAPLGAARVSLAGR
ncbi:MAG TPA: hypothetical protein VHS99_03420 [Chloroflexota bacterium]|nr:hypothetical protein [Chloroflexota bacterium]